MLLCKSHHKVVFPLERTSHGGTRIFLCQRTLINQSKCLSVRAGSKHSRFGCCFISTSNNFSRTTLAITLKSAIRLTSAYHRRRRALGARLGRSLTEEITRLFLYVKIYYFQLKQKKSYRHLNSGFHIYTFLDCQLSFFPKFMHCHARERWYKVTSYKM